MLYPLSFKGKYYRLESELLDHFQTTLYTVGMTIKVLLTRLVTTSLLALGLNFIETSQAQAVSPCSNVDINYYINDAKNLIEVRSKGAPNREILQQGNQNNIVGIYRKDPA